MFTHPRWSVVLALAALEFLGAGTVLAQPQILSVDELRRALSPGDSITVVDTTGTVVRGKLLRFADAEVDIQAETQERSKRNLVVTIPLGTIQSLERPRDSSKNGMLIGAGIGAAIAAGLFAYAAVVDANEMDEWGPIYAGLGVGTAAIGAIIGWTIDSAKSKPRVQFRAGQASSWVDRARRTQ